MTSRQVEDVHEALLRQLLADSGLDCIRSPHVSTELPSSSGESEEQGPCEEEEEEEEELLPENFTEEVEPMKTEEEPHEELPDIFPTPSLRRVLSDRTRKIEEQNRIHVLPKKFRTLIDPAFIPKIAVTVQQKYIDVLAEIVGCKMYKSSLAEFWFLDTLANLLRRAQEDELDRPTQAVLILWFCEWMKEMEQFDAADRQRMLRRFQDNMLAASQFIAEEEHLPTPAEVGVTYEAPNDPTQSRDKISNAPSHSKQMVTWDGAAYECSLRDLTKIIHYIFDLFSTDYQYNLVRSVFTFSPEYNLIDAPSQLQNPKRTYTVVKIKPKKEKPAKKDAKAIKNKKDFTTEEYVALMELKEKEERELEELEELDREMWNRKSHILPLVFAANDAFFDKYWPPPPPEPEPEPQPDLKGKGKGKGKK